MHDLGRTLDEFGPAELLYVTSRQTFLRALMNGTSENGWSREQALTLEGRFCLCGIYAMAVRRCPS
jgi:hypothetical protein